MPTTFRLKIPPELKSFITHLPPALKHKIRSGIDSLLRKPAEGKSLRAEILGLSSLPVGRFRIIYRSSGTFLEIVAVGPRTTVYQEISRCIKTAQ